MSDRKRVLKERRRSLWRIFAIPFALGIVSAIGLVVALVGDDLWDAAGWSALAIPVLVTVWCWCRRAG